MKDIYALYDSVAGCWVGQLLVDRSAAPIVRSFHDLLRDDKSVPGQHPDDYSIIRVGRISDDGVIEVSPIEVIATGTQWKAAVASLRENGNV